MYVCFYICLYVCSHIIFIYTFLFVSMLVILFDFMFVCFCEFVNEFAITNLFVSLCLISQPNI